MFSLFNRTTGAGDTIADEALISQSCAGRTDGIRLSLEFLGYVPKGPTKAQVLRVLDDIIGNPADVKGTDAIRVALPLFAAASVLMLRQGDRALADSFQMNFNKGMADLKAARATARAVAKTKGKAQTETPTTTQTETPTTTQTKTPTTTQTKTPTTTQTETPTTVQTPDPIDAAIALLDAAVNANTLTDAQCAALRAMLERLAIPA
jgi:hypothetical protein